MWRNCIGKLVKEIFPRLYKEFFRTLQPISLSVKGNFRRGERDYCTGSQCVYDFSRKSVVTTLKNKTLAGAGCVQKDTTVDYCHTYNLRKWVVSPGNVKPASAYPLTCLCTELHLPWRVSSKQLSASCPWVDAGSDFHTSALRGVALAMRLLTPLRLMMHKARLSYSRCVALAVVPRNACC